MVLGNTCEFCNLIKDHFWQEDLRIKQANKQKILLFFLENLVLNFSGVARVCAENSLMCCSAHGVRSGRGESPGSDSVTGQTLELLVLSSVDLTFMFFLDGIPLTLTSLVSRLPPNPLRVKMMPTEQYHSKCLACFPLLTSQIWVIVLLFRNKKGLDREDPGPRGEGSLPGASVWHGVNDHWS